MTSVTLIAASDKAGGAAIAANRLNAGLVAAGINSQMCVGTKVTADPAVWRGGSPPMSLAENLGRRIRRKQISRSMAPYETTKLETLELFSDDRSPDGLRWSHRLLDTEVFNLHWVAGFLDYRRFFQSLPAGFPLVWTLHDMNPLTGGCHYSLGCEKFTSRCGPCPQLGSSDPHDRSAAIQRRKAAALSALVPETTRIVAPSAWLAREASRSALLGRFDVDQIPNGLDTSVFRPRRKEVAREVLGLPAEAPVVLFLADLSTNHRKGFDLLEAAVAGLSDDRRVTLAAIGSSLPSNSRARRVMHLGRIDNERLLSFAYSAADVFVAPTRADNLPNVILEAMACGTPVVGFDVGGIPDMVRPGETGVLAAPEDVAGLSSAIETLLADEDLRTRMSARCREIAVKEYSLEVQAKRYVEVYSDLIGASLTKPWFA